jgi:hypothetical protein
VRVLKNKIKESSFANVCECAVLIFEGHAGAKLSSFPMTHLDPKMDHPTPQPFTGIT